MKQERYVRRSIHMKTCTTIFAMSLMAAGLSHALGIDYQQNPMTPNPMATNPHASPPGPNTPLPSGIVGLALHVTAGRIGDPAQLIIRAVHPAGPAGRAGLVHGEEVFAVNQEPVKGKTYQHVISLIRGEVGTSVNLSLRGPRGERTIKLMRVSEERLMEQTPPAL